jgi:sugar lactone lactonase YvrE
MFRIRIILLLTAAAVAAAQDPGDYSVRSAIGSGSRGDGGSATAALLDGPYGLAQDAAGNVYISESNAGVIRIVRPFGRQNHIIERYAGSGILADGVEGQAALATDLLSPTALVIDPDGSLVFADAGACRIRKVLGDGTIKNLVGTGRCSGASTAGPGGGTTSGAAPPLQTDIGAVGGMVFDSLGRLNFTDATSNLVRRVDSDGLVRSIAGTGTAGFSGDGSTAVVATLRSPQGIAIDNAGNIYVADSSNCRIRRVDTGGNINTVAGNSTCATASTSWNGVSLGRLNGLAFDSATNSLLIAAAGLKRLIRLALTAPALTTFVGKGTTGAVESAARLQYPVDEPTAVLISGTRVLITDNTAFRVLQVQNDLVTAFAGSWPQLTTYPSAYLARLLRPSGLCARQDGSLLVMDAGAERVFSFNNPDQLTTFAGVLYPTGYSGGDGDAAIAAQVNQPRRFACSSNGNVYFTHGHEIRMINSQGIIQTVLSFVQVTGQSSGVTFSTSLNDPTGIVIDGQGRLVFSEASLNRVIRYDLATRIGTLIAGTGVAGFSGDGTAAIDAQLSSPGDLAFDSNGNLLIADRNNGRIRSVSPGGIINTVAGSSRGFSYADISGQSATSIGLGTIEGMTVDASGRIYLTETPRLSVIQPDGRIYVVAGFVSQDDDGVITYFNGPMNGCDGVAVDGNGRVYLSLAQAGQVMLVLPNGDPGPAPFIRQVGAYRTTSFGAFSPFFRRIFQGSWIQIYGTNLASGTSQGLASDLNGGQMPTLLTGTTVSIAGQAAFISYVSPGQISAQVPVTAPIGNQEIIVSTAAGTSQQYPITIEARRVRSLTPAAFSPAAVGLDHRRSRLRR